MLLEKQWPAAFFGVAGTQSTPAMTFFAWKHVLSLHDAFAKGLQTY